MITLDDPMDYKSLDVNDLLQLMEMFRCFLVDYANYLRETDKTYGAKSAEILTGDAYFELPDMDHEVEPFLEWLKQQ